MAGRPTSPRDLSRPPSRRSEFPHASLAHWFAPWSRLALSMGALLVLLVTLGAWLHGLLGMLHSEAGRYDFSTYYAAAAALRADIHTNIYAPTVLAASGTHAAVLVRPPLPYVYPPLFALLLAPFTLLSFSVLSRLWLLGNALLWLAMVPLLARELWFPLHSSLTQRLPPHRPDEGQPQPFQSQWHQLLWERPAPLLSLALAALLILPAAPAIQTALTGQVDFLVLLPLALIPELTRRGNERAVGVMIGLAALLKFTPLVLVGYLLLRRRWRAAWGALGTVCALTLLSGLLVGPGVLFASIDAALRTGASDAAMGHNEALFASLPGVHTGLLAALLILTRVALALGGAALLWRLPWRMPRATGDALAYGVALCLMLLLAPTVWVHHYVWALPAAAIALGYSLVALLHAWGTKRTRRAGWLFGGVILASLALIWALPGQWDTEPAPTATMFAGLPVRPFALELRALGTLALLLALAALGRLLLRRRGAGVSDVSGARTWRTVATEATEDAAR